jgi:hypothetical protein
VVAPDDLDHTLVPEIAEPYLGETVGVHGDWASLRDRGWPFREAAGQRRSVAVQEHARDLSIDPVCFSRIFCPIPAHPLE